MHLSRRRRAMMAAVATLCAGGALAPSALAASGDLPRLVQGAPTAITGGFFDDHSIGGDNHLGWDHGASDPEALRVSFSSSLTNIGDGALQLCGTDRNGGWMRTYQDSDDDLTNCTTTGTPVGWDRYVTANHSDTSEFNRWHTMDLQRFALVPITAASGLPATAQPFAPAGALTYWDTQWGTCLSTDMYMDCEHGAAATATNGGIAGHNTVKATQEGAPDQTVIAFPHEIPSGRYQVVAMSNPYGALREAGTSSGSVSCSEIQVTFTDVIGAGGDVTGVDYAVTPAADAPAQCLLPQTMPAAISGPTGVDPLAGESATTPGCTLVTVPTATGHCWATIPDASTVDDPHPTAKTNATGTPTATNTIRVAQFSALRSDTPVTTPTDPTSPVTPTTPVTSANPVATPTPVTAVPLPTIAKKATPLALPALRTASAKTKARTALRRMFGTLPSSAKVSCVNTGGSSARCAVNWRTATSSYSGTVRISFASNTQHVRWVYSANVHRKTGRTTRTVSRSGVTGGNVSLTSAA